MAQQILYLIVAGFIAAVTLVLAGIMVGTFVTDRRVGDKLGELSDLQYSIKNEISTISKLLTDRFAVPPVDTTPYLASLIERLGTRFEQALSKTEEPLADMRSIVQSRLDLLVKKGDDINAGTNLLSQTISGIRDDLKVPRVVEAPPVDAIVAAIGAIGVPEAIEKINTSIALMKESVDGVSALTIGLTEVCKTLAAAAYRIEKSSANPYEEYAGRDSRSTENKVRMVMKDFGLDREAALELVNSGRS